jgi:hypothetical protein
MEVDTTCACIGKGCPRYEECTAKTVQNSLTLEQKKEAIDALANILAKLDNLKSKGLLPKLSPITPQEGPMKIKVFEIYDDWYAATSAEEALNEYFQYCGEEGGTSLENVKELTQKELAEFIFYSEDEPIPFEKELARRVAECEKFPQRFAFSE